jgi:YidC/Oxa1 family membrane protein insertase
VIPYAILGPIERILTDLLEWFHGTVGLTWAVSIIALTVLVRIVMVPLTVRQIHSMQKLQMIAPELKAIQQKYKNDKQRQQQEVMAFYKENKVNPAASCLPVLVQIPIFISLFFVLKDFEKEVFPQYPGSDLGFLGIVPNITEQVSAHWSGYLLLVLYVASQLLSTLLTPITDRTQRALFIALPFVFIFFVINFPVGLMLYWVTTNLWTIGQGLVTRRLMPRPATPPKRTSRTPPKEPAAAKGGGAKTADGKASGEPKPAQSGTGSGQRRVRRRKRRGPQARR